MHRLKIADAVLHGAGAGLVRAVAVFGQIEGEDPVSPGDHLPGQHLGFFFLGAFAVDVEKQPVGWCSEEQRRNGADGLFFGNH